MVVHNYPTLDRRGQGRQNEVSTTDFGHLGVFPETRAMWEWIRDTIKESTSVVSLHFLNLFAYSGGATLPQHKAVLIAVTLTPPKVWSHGHERTPN